MTSTTARPAADSGLLQGWLGKALIGAFTGAVWAVTIAIVVAMSASLITGAAFSPHLWAWTISGVVAGAGYGMWGKGEQALLSFGRGYVIALLLTMPLTVASLAPFGFSFGEGAFAYLVVLAIALACLYYAITICLAPIEAGPMNKFRREKSLMLTLRGFGLVFFGFVVMLPLYVMFMSSLTTQQVLFDNPLNLWPDFSDGLFKPFASYFELWNTFNFGTYIWNSALVSVVTVVLTLIMAVPGAYAVSRLDFPGRIGLSRSILAIYLVPAIVLVVPLYVVFTQIGLRGSLLGLMVVYPATTLPVALYMLQGYFRGLPAELEEAGLMDGCSRLRVIWEITMPLALPAIASVSLYVFMIAWNEFLFAFMFLDDPAAFTLPKGVNSLNSSEVPRQHLMAGAVISTVPIVVVFLAAERFLVQGLASGGVKG